MAGSGSRFNFRTAQPPGGSPRRQPALKPAADTIFAPRTSRPFPAAAPRTRTILPVAALLVAATALAAALIRRVAMYDLTGLELFRFNGVAVPLVTAVLTLLVLSGRDIARGRALAGLAIAAALCPFLVALGGFNVIGMATMLSAAIAFAALPIALDWAALRGAPSGARAATLVAAAQLGGAIGNAPSLTDIPSLPVISAVLLALVIPSSLAAAAWRRRPEAEPRPALPATQAILGNYAMLGLIAAALVAAAGMQILTAALPYVAMGSETVAEVATTTMMASFVALVAGGVLADRLAKDARGYGLWFAAMLGLAGIVVLYAARLDLTSAGLALLLARLLPSAGIGAALALIFRLAPPPARLGALLAFLAARAIGAAIVAPAIARGDPGLGLHAIGYGAIDLLAAAAIMAATLPRVARRP